MHTEPDAAMQGISHAMLPILHQHCRCLDSWLRQLMRPMEPEALTAIRLRVRESRISLMTTVCRTAPIRVLYQLLLACMAAFSARAAAAAACKSAPNQDFRTMLLCFASPATAAHANTVVHHGGVRVEHAFDHARSA